MLDNPYRSLAFVYDRFMSNVDYDIWADYLLTFIRNVSREKYPQVIDCACGTGALLCRLAKAGMDVTGVDISAEMLQIAQEKLRMAGYGRMPLVHEDMRQLRVHHPVDCILLTCDGINYLAGDSDAERFFMAAHAALKPNGLLLFDISSMFKLTQVLAGHAFGEDCIDCAYLCQNSYDKKRRLLQMDLSIFVRGEDGSYRREEETHFLRAYETAELETRLSACGFESIQIFEAFTMNTPHDDSERIQFCARRAENG